MARTFCIIVVFLFFDLQVGLGQLIQITSGVSFAKNVGGNGYETVYGRTSVGYKIGIASEFPLGLVNSIQTGVYFSNLGSAFAQDMSSTENGSLHVGEKKNRLVLNYIQVPVVLTTNVRLNTRLRWILGLGPYAAIRINKSKQQFVIAKRENHIVGLLKAGSDDTYRRLDAGITAMTGLGFENGLSVTLHYDYGCLNIVQADYKNALYNRSFNIALGYYINQKHFMKRHFAFN